MLTKITCRDENDSLSMLEWTEKWLDVQTPLNKKTENERKTQRSPVHHEFDGFGCLTDNSFCCTVDKSDYVLASGLKQQNKNTLVYFKTMSLKHLSKNTCHCKPLLFGQPRASFWVFNFILFLIGFSAPPCLTWVNNDKLVVFLTGPLDLIGHVTKAPVGVALGNFQYFSFQLELMRRRRRGQAA